MLSMGPKHGVGHVWQRHILSCGRLDKNNTKITPRLVVQTVKGRGIF